MGNIHRAGFTIIETVLFLGISSFLIVALILGAGNSINEQRYNDSVETFKSLLQQQYAGLTSVQNSRDNNWSCGTTATPTTTGTVKNDRGQSECILVGKYLRLEDKKISNYNVVAYHSVPGSLANDIDSLKTNYVLNVSKADVENSTMEWDTKISYPASGGSGFPVVRKLGILVIRSPDSGQIYTFSNSDVDVPLDSALNGTSIKNMLLPGSAANQAERLICVNSTGLLSNGSRGVMLRAYATTSSAVEIVSNDYLSEVGSPYRC